MTVSLASSKHSLSRVNESAVNDTKIIFFFKQNSQCRAFLCRCVPTGISRFMFAPFVDMYGKRSKTINYFPVHRRTLAIFIQDFRRKRPSHRQSGKNTLRRRVHGEKVHPPPPTCEFLHTRSQAHITNIRDAGRRTQNHIAVRRQRRCDGRITFSTGKSLFNIIYMYMYHSPMRRSKSSLIGGRPYSLIS